MMDVYKRGDVMLVDLGGSVGSEQSGVRPCLVISNPICNKFSPILLVCPITSRLKKMMPTHVELMLKEPSFALLEQCMRIDRGRILHKICSVTEEDMKKIDKAILIAYGLPDYSEQRQTVCL